MRENNLEILDIFLNEKEILVYIIDIKTNEVLYVNESVKNIFKEKDIVGKKCYEVFQNHKKQCHFCKTSIIEKHSDDFYISEYYNERLNKYFKVKEKIITWIDGRDVKIEIATCIGNEVNKELGRVIRYERKLEEILDDFEKGKGIDYLVNKTLELIGEYMRAARAYIFDIDLFGNVISNTYEWCNLNVESQIENLKRIPCTDMPWWMGKLLNDETIFISNIDEMPKEAENERSALKAQGIKSVIAIPFKIFGQLYGFVGIDDIYAYSIEAEKNMESLMNFVSVISKLMESNYKGCNSNKIKSIYNTILETTVNPTAIIGEKGNIIVYNEELRNFIELDEKDCIRGIFIDNYLEPEMDIESKENKVYKIQTKNGIKYGIVTSKKIINSEQYIVTLFDITEIKNKEKELEVLSYTDKLTNLYNRNKYIKDVGRISKKEVIGLGVIICDIDGLKFINDSLGHDYGDRVIRRFAKILRENTRREDLKYRIGGDEFIIINKNVTKERLTKIVERVKGNIKKINKDEKENFMSVSIGMAYSNERSIEELIKEADLNMYREKVINNKSVANEIISGFTRALETKDYGMLKHGKRMEKYALQIGDKLLLDRKRKEKLSLLCKFHDIGKIAIENEILFKPDKLTKEEFEKVKKHSEIGYRISRNSKALKGISDFILKHHERYDGKGYPLGLKGNEIPLECRIISLVDTFDVIVNERHYKKANSREFAIEEIKNCTGTQFDPEISNIFLNILENE
ncbi:MAG: diguanylate cyclase [Clostridium sp.]|uniref:diguanylate cyclase n=1 Tax=Clostridium sp. TaxID=1506 RepID=UPI003F414089